MEKYTIGIDYGTLSARAVLINVTTGAEAASAEFVYPHGVMDRQLPCGTPLNTGSALQHPQDYIDALHETVSAVISGIEPAQVVGLCIDVTACTVLPVDAELTPLCFTERFASNPYAYVAMWKHRGAEPQGARITELAQRTNQPWLGALGGKVSAEWLLSKLLALREHAPELYQSTTYFIEAGDWLTWLLTGSRIRSSCMAGFKGLWTKRAGYPDREFLSAVHPDFAEIQDTLLFGKVQAPGTCAGHLNAYGAELLGLPEGTAVSVPIIDGHAGLPGMGICESGHLMLVIGTSACHIVLDKEDLEIPGICGKVPDGILPDFVAYEAGQVCVGDMFSWFMKNAVPAQYLKDAESQGISIFDYMDEKASQIPPGENKILVLDWWNGNRTPYADYTLSGAVFGYTLSTRPEDVYLALIEATAYGTKRILELYEQNGVHIHKITAGGGIAQKNKRLMQIYADVLGMEIEVTSRTQAGATGCAMLAASAAGVYKDVVTAVSALAAAPSAVFYPDLENTAKYQAPYQRYCALSEHFAKAPF